MFGRRRDGHRDAASVAKQVASQMGMKKPSLNGNQHWRIGEAKKKEARNESQMGLNFD